MPSSIRAILNSMIAQFGYRVTRAIDEPRQPFALLPLIIPEIIRQRGECFVVQIGANDGISNDPVRKLILDHRLPGLLVEPVPYLFERLKENYKDQRQLEYRRCAIGRHDGTITMFAFARDNPFPSWAQGLAGVSRRHMESFGLANADKFIEKLKVPAVTLDSLLASYRNQEIGLLQIDTEGFDAEIVRQVVKSAYRPIVINYEHKHLSKTDRVDCKQRLREAGYSFVDVYPDTIALYKDVSFG